MAAPAAESWTSGPSGGAITSAWNGTATLAVTSTGTTFGGVTFGGVVLAATNVVLPGWQTGAPS